MHGFPESTMIRIGSRHIKVQMVPLLGPTPPRDGASSARIQYGRLGAAWTTHTIVTKL